VAERRALKIEIDGFWLAIIYAIAANGTGRKFELWDVRVERSEKDINDWLALQPGK
jgi:hypothetical protein